MEKKYYDEESNNGYILKVDIDYPIIFIMIYHFYQEELKLINVINLYAICIIRKLCYSYKNFKTSIKS